MMHLQPEDGTSADKAEGGSVVCSSGVGGGSMKPEL